ncbi:non-hydrolyzing UDP-N-acetylglucosamine 2-epimerase [Flammeovirga kamogawensis]|uniref:UDP-N-acetylglucosamine 2-epimerase (non-hydrolyzing) n=1 Tax=Flammeovirga kamogawensis TaxID=373891 RepID=A0ABX8GZD2_9BACT|nr:UDP-N-acetylglucosamine 2-epimerase (non-hydrolyzing) [Flammeovirga kamogawensis]MBB6458886.1 UDP-N-acetylglucosamine 2-epimerase (non-hydrolyzing) [Flammeovirga kamogawensis]QWG08467.1 UDP-N-acetylglucosamine 2-epimerase (non-hydrolyzing) [Flammeovirga kamogawensis]TRX66763.1 UDP-N-acetylglucosamine 2-epimerase (non-hydrolyzing) [Flammeovirga kamogawensis]
MQKILLVFGTRPEAIKMAPLVKEFQKDQGNFDTKVCVTAQHREMLDQVLEFYEITPDYDLDLMKPNQNLFTLTADIITGMKPILDEFQPDHVFVHGDTTTTMATSLAAFYGGAKVSHIEAGLRTYNKLSPFPEEINRQITGRIADYNFAPTKTSEENLLSEKTPAENILVTGNTVIDALYFSVEKVNQLENHPEIEKLKNLVDTSKDLVLVTGHRRENHGQGFLNICQALKNIAEQSDAQIIYPVHLNPNVQKPVYEILSDVDNVHLIDPLSYPSFVWLMDKAKLIVTDSGGVQEEAPSLGKPVLVMRDTTERPEAVDAGTVILVGTNTEKITSEGLDLLINEERYKQMSQLHNPYGDGKASQRVVNFMRELEVVPH